MKFRPGGGLHPATDAARSAARTAQPVPRTYGRPPPDEQRVGPWRLFTDTNGDLVAEHVTRGVRRVLASLTGASDIEPVGQANDAAGGGTDQNDSDKGRGT